jgi:DNA-directed RNA polymerase beta subunit
MQLFDDIKILGFRSHICIKIEKKNNAFETWKITENGAFAYFMYVMGAFVEVVEKKTNRIRNLPLWLVDSDLSIKREFLSAFQGGNGSCLSYQKNAQICKPFLGITCKTTHNTFLNDTIEYMTEIKKLFTDLGIQCQLNNKKMSDDKTIVYISFKKSINNLTRYADVITYTYCDEKRKKSAPIIEHLKIRSYNKTHKNIITYNHFIKDNIVDNGCMCVPIESIVEIPPEMVYDFTTKSENHSFVASSFVVSNCPVETPEGASVGVVKNLSYMTHITIYSDSSSIYNFIQSHIIQLSDLSPKELYSKVKVIMNGCWVGISDKPKELYDLLKEKKHQGVFNIYTSIVFDYRLGEIRICNDSGRITRPVLRVKNNNILFDKKIINDLKSKKLGWDDLLTSCNIPNAVIEYIDPEEQSLSMIAIKPKNLVYTDDIEKVFKYTHCEIHPNTIFGILASCIPFPEHNQSPRNTYQCLDSNELVYMADGTKLKIADVKIGDQVLTFHPHSMKITSTKVTHHYVRPTDKIIYKVTTVTGREIVATEDHMFMCIDIARHTNPAWKTVTQMKSEINSTQIGVYIEKEEDFVTEQLKVFKNTSDRYVHRIRDVMFISLKCIVVVENRLISDITVESSNHSFIAGHGNFLSHNCAQAKQAMGVYATNYANRMDKTAYILNYPAKPLVDTRIMEMIGINEIPSGMTCMVAIMTHTGYNQEDSLLFNKGSVDRGLFQATIYHTEKDEDKQKINGDEEIRCKPDPTKTKGMKFANYNKVNSKGLIPENTLVQNRDVIIAKITPIKENRNDHTKVIKYEDQSRIYRTDEETYIDKNYIDKNGDGYTFAKVRTRVTRKPVIGDKFSTKAGQKGTLGNLIPEEDMPFTKTGLKPDLILNPHAIPSRMTIAQLKETVLSKVLLELGLFGDGTSFGELDIKLICDHLIKLGYESHGNELLYNGLTGEQHECIVFTGPVFYQRLKHMVSDKYHSRSNGPMVNLTRQPAEGRSRDGGLRFGEMEKDTTVAHGAARFTKERLFDVSDKYHVYTCKKCGMIASYNDSVHIHKCNTCDNRTEFSYVELPYACKLMFQELMTMNIAPRIMT